jgi:hypothetical protein
MVTSIRTGSHEADPRRVDALNDLLRRRIPVGDGIRNLGRFPWDSPEELAVLAVADVVSALESYALGEMDPDDLESWAEAIAGRDDVAMETAAADVLTRAIFELSSPELFGPVASTAPHLLESLRAIAGSGDEAD